MNDNAPTNSENRTTLQGTLNSAAETIRAEISAHGTIPFSRFMELALYCPDCGFYEKEPDTVGRAGEFYTSVSVGGLFGQLLAFQFTEWTRRLAATNVEMKIVEVGAHDGRLMRDILSWFQARRPELLEQLGFWIVEPSPRRQSWQVESLQEFDGNVRWAASMADVGVVEGVIFSNEFLDAMPVRRFGWDATRRAWFEWGVSIEKEDFVWKRMSAAVLEISFTLHIPSELEAVLPDGFTLENSPAAQSWWREAARTLRRGKLLTFDYGLSSEEFWSPERRGGTVRAYRDHQLLTDVLSNPGEQDITAHVNFTEIQAAGERAGLETEAFLSQTEFLTNIASRTWEGGSRFGEWTPQRTRQFQTLTHPDHLGRGFRVLIQSR